MGATPTEAPNFSTARNSYSAAAPPPRTEIPHYSTAKSFLVVPTTTTTSPMGWNRENDVFGITMDLTNGNNDVGKRRDSSCSQKRVGSVIFSARVHGRMKTERNDSQRMQVSSKKKDVDRAIGSRQKRL